MGIHQYLDLSTAHITPETLIHNKCHRYLLADYEYGAIFRVPPIELLLEDPDIPSDLEVILCYASCAGCYMVRFDADAPIIETLPQYAWVETLQV